MRSMRCRELRQMQRVMDGRWTTPQVHVSSLKFMFHPTPDEKIFPGF